MKQNIIRVATYLRVSHEDQKKFGDSIATQRQHLEKFLANNPNMIHVDEYSDEGISANKLSKRTELQRLLWDIEENKIDLVIFTKLDRWFRSVAKYYKIQEVLEAHNVAWQAILEDYETVTANGKFKVNIMLSVAQQERDRTSERIKDVFQYKISQGQSIVPSSSLPFYMTIEETDGIKKVVHNPETEAMTYDWLNHLKKYNSRRRSFIYINDKYDVHFDYSTLSRASKNTLLYGCYRDNEDYCEPYMTKKEFMQLQESLKKNIKVRKNNFIYVFSGKLKCPYCGGGLVGGTTKFVRANGEKGITYFYTCKKAYLTKDARHEGHIKSISEKKIEKQILKKIKFHIEKYISEKEGNEKKEFSKPRDIKSERKKIQEQLDRLNKLYLKGRISEEDYEFEYEEMENKLNELDNVKEEKKDLANLKKLLEMDFEKQYIESDRLTKQAFWNSIVKEIVIDSNESKRVIDVIFLS